MFASSPFFPNIDSVGCSETSASFHQTSLRQASKDSGALHSECPIIFISEIHGRYSWLADSGPGFCLLLLFIVLYKISRQLVIDGDNVLGAWAVLATFRKYLLSLSPEQTLSKVSDSLSLRVRSCAPETSDVLPTTTLFYLQF